MSVYDNWPDPALRMRNVDEPEPTPRSEKPGRVPPRPDIDLARKAVRVRGLTDPLGAMGQRDPRPRIAKEGRLRRIAVAGSVLSFAGSLGFIAWGANVASGNAGNPDSGSAIEAASLATSTPTVIASSNQPSQLVNTDRTSLAADATTPSPAATSTAASTKTSATAKSKKKTATATKTPTPTATATATDVPAPTDTPVTSHVRSHSSG